MLSNLTKYCTLDNLRKVIEALGGRRFIISCGAGVITSALVWYAKITPEVYRDVILGTVGLYIAGNTFQKTRSVVVSEDKGN